jgi:hypothetical protein
MYPLGCKQHQEILQLISDSFQNPLVLCCVNVDFEKMNKKHRKRLL